MNIDVSGIFFLNRGENKTVHFKISSVLSSSVTLMKLDVAAENWLDGVG